MYGMFLSIDELLVFGYEARWVGNSEIQGVNLFGKIIVSE